MKRSEKSLEFGDVAPQTKYLCSCLKSTKLNLNTVIDSVMRFHPIAHNQVKVTLPTQFCLQWEEGGWCKAEVWYGYVKSATGYSKVNYWFTEFRRNRSSTNDAPQSRMSQDAITPENIGRISGNCWVTKKLNWSELVNIIGVSLLFRLFHAALLFHQDNLLAHSSCDTTDKFKELLYELVPTHRICQIWPAVSIFSYRN